MENNEIINENRNEDMVQEEMERHFDEPAYYPSERVSGDVVDSSNDDGDSIGAAEVLVAGAAAVGIGTVGYGIYKGIKWIVGKIKGSSEEEEDDEDEEEKPRKKAKKKPVKKSKKTSSKKARKPEPEDPDDEEDFVEDEESENEEEE